MSRSLRNFGDSSTARCLVVIAPISPSALPQAIEDRLHHSDLVTKNQTRGTSPACISMHNGTPCGRDEALRSRLYGVGERSPVITPKLIATGNILETKVLGHPRVMIEPMRLLTSSCEATLACKESSVRSQRRLPWYVKMNYELKSIKYLAVSEASRDIRLLIDGDVPQAFVHAPQQGVRRLPPGDNKLLGDLMDPEVASWLPAGASRGQLAVDDQSD